VWTGDGDTGDKLALAWSSASGSVMKAEEIRTELIEKKKTKWKPLALYEHDGLRGEGKANDC
jgi:hypothetical protein